MVDTKKRFLDIFLREWALDRKKGVEGPVERGDSTIGEVPFETDVRPGEIRVFADGGQPRIGLVLLRQRTDAWLVVPVSEFTVPATEQEILIGERVYQLWNAFTAPATFAARSWIVETLAADDVRDVARALANVLAGDTLPDDLAELVGLPIVAMDDPRLDYERAFAWRPVARAAASPAVRRWIFAWRRSLVGIAACFAILCGTVTMILRDKDAERPPACATDVPVVREQPIEVSKEPIPETEKVETPSTPIVEPAVEPVVEEKVDESVAKPVVEPVAKPVVEERPVVQTPVETKPVPPAPVEEEARPPAPAVEEKPAAPSPPPVTEEKSMDSDLVERACAEANIRKSDEMLTASACKACEKDVCEKTMATAADLDDFGEDWTEDAATSMTRTKKSARTRDVSAAPDDSSSYGIMRQHLLVLKRLPPKESVRLDAYVNSFAFSYPKPKDGQPVAIDCELAVCPWNKAHRLLRVGLQAKSEKAELFGSERPVVKAMKLQLVPVSGQGLAVRPLDCDGRFRVAMNAAESWKDLGELRAGGSVTVFYEIEPVDRLAVWLRYQSSDSDEVRRLDQSVVAAQITRTDGPSQDFLFASAVAEFALILKGSPHKGNASFDSIAARATAALCDDPDGRRSEFIRLVLFAQRIVRQR